MDGVCARSTRRRHRRSPSTGRTACTTASVAKRGRRHHLRARDRAPRLRRRRRVARRQGRHHAALHDDGRGQGAQATQAAGRQRWRPRSTGTTSACCPRPTPAAARGLPAVARARRRDVRQYRLGWAPDGWDALSRALRLPDDVLRDTGLGFLNRRNRAAGLVPSAGCCSRSSTCRATRSRSAGASCPVPRDRSTRTRPRRRSTRRAEVLYGLNWAKAEIVAADEVIVCEGYTDVIGFDCCGVPRAVATCGTALTEDHLRSLRKFARRLVLAFDADAAGQAAAERFYEWERRFDLDVAVAALPKGIDPATWRAAIRRCCGPRWPNAVPFLGFRVGRVLDAARLSTPEGRARAAEAALAVIARAPERARARPVRDAGRRSLPASTPIGCAACCSRAVRTGTVSMPAEQASTASVRDRRGGLPPMLLMHRWDETAPFLSDVLFSDVVTLDAFRALAATCSRAGRDRGRRRRKPQTAGASRQEADQAAALDPAVEIGHLITNAAQRRLAAILAGPEPTDRRRRRSPTDRRGPRAKLRGRKRPRSC